MATGEVDLQSQRRVENVSTATGLAAYGVWESSIFTLNRGQSRLKGFAVDVPVASGYKFQFRSSNTSDLDSGAALTLDNLDIITVT